MKSEDSDNERDTERLDGVSLMEGMDQVLEKINEQRWWIWGVFLLASSPGMFNAYHIMVSNFYAYVPPHWCKIAELEEAGWTDDQIKTVSVSNMTSDASCNMLAWNYTLLAEMEYSKAIAFVNSTPKPPEIPCSQFKYEEKKPRTTTVSEWDLVCDKKLHKSNIQGSIAVGKLVGGFLFGAIADKFGRKVGFILSCLTYMVFGPLAAFSPNFWFFIATRFLIGIAGSGCYETGFTILAELVSKKRRASLGCIYNLSYPVGYMTLPIIAFLIPTWRELQLAISIPMLLLFINCWFLPESPRWLITQGRVDEAWKIVKRIDQNLVPVQSEQSIQEVQSVSSSIFSKFIGGSQKMLALFSTVELCKRIAIAYFAWFVAALIYYVLALNAVNFEMNQYLYTFLSGLVEIPGYSMPILILIWLGRKPTTALLYFISGSALVSITGIPKEQTTVILIVALLGRFTDVAVFGVIVVYTSELFPTTVRNTAIGSSLAVSQFGSIYAPYIVDILGLQGWYIPSLLCGCMALLCAVFVLLLPETHGKPLLNTIDEVKKSERKDKVSIKNCCTFS